MRSYITARRADTTCPACNTLFEGLLVAADEDGFYVEIETVPCTDDECATSLCSCCPQFTCACCGLKFCMEHLGREEDPECTCILTGDQADARCCDAHGTRNPRPVLLCRACAAPEEVEARIEPVTECGPITDAA
jgi:hypothetical protein